MNEEQMPNPAVPPEVKPSPGSVAAASTVDHSPWVREIAEADFQREVLERSHHKPVVVDFWAPWCGPCRRLGPILERLVNERQGTIEMVKVNTDDAPRLSRQFGIDGIPLVMGFRNGKPVKVFQSLVPEPAIRQFLDALLPSQADLAAEQALQQETGNPELAEQLYRRVLEQQRDHAASLLGLARLLLARNQEAEAIALLDRLPPGSHLAAEADQLRASLALRELGKDLPDEATLRYQLGCVLAAAGKYPEALEQLLAAARADKHLAQEKVKETMVRIFQVIGVRSPLADDYREKLAQVLY